MTIVAGGKLLARTAELRDGAIVFIDDTREREVTSKKRKAADGAKASCPGCSFLRRLASGGVGLLKAELGVDAAGDELEAARRATCESCEAWDHGVCTDCSCFTAAKVKIKSEQCPRGLWPTIGAT